MEGYSPTGTSVAIQSIVLYIGLCSLNYTLLALSPPPKERKVYCRLPITSPPLACHSEPATLSEFYAPLPIHLAKVQILPWPIYLAEGAGHMSDMVCITVVPTAYVHLADCA